MSSGSRRSHFIPAYQRGFRWNPTQVTQLLDDIREFARRQNPQPEEFYLYRRTKIGQRGECNHAADVSANDRRAAAGDRYPSRAISHSWL